MLSRLLSISIIEVANSNGFGIKHLRILNTFKNLEGTHNNFFFKLASDVLTKAYPKITFLADYKLVTQSVVEKIIFEGLGHKMLCDE